MYADQDWEADANYAFGNRIGDMTSLGLSRAEEILKAGRDWDKEQDARKKVF